MLKLSEPTEDVFILRMERLSKELDELIHAIQSREKIDTELLEDVRSLKSDVDMELAGAKEFAEELKRRNKK